MILTIRLLGSFCILLGAAYMYAAGWWLAKEVIRYVVVDMTVGGVYLALGIYVMLEQD